MTRSAARHDRLISPALFKALPMEHVTLAQHLRAKTEEFVTRKGVVTKWERVRQITGDQPRPILGQLQRERRYAKQSSWTDRE